MIDATVTIRRNSDGVEREYFSGGYDDLEILEYIWTHGNYGCDCNRELFFRRAGGEDPEILSTACGEGGYSVVRVVLSDGRVLVPCGEFLELEEQNDS